MKTTNFLSEKIEDLNKKIRGLIGEIARRDHEDRGALYIPGVAFGQTAPWVFNGNLNPTDRKSMQKAKIGRSTWFMRIRPGLVGTGGAPHFSIC